MCRERTLEKREKSKRARSDSFRKKNKRRDHLCERVFDFVLFLLHPMARTKPIASKAAVNRDASEVTEGSDEMQGTAHVQQTVDVPTPSQRSHELDTEKPNDEETRDISDRMQKRSKTEKKINADDIVINVYAESTVNPKWYCSVDTHDTALITFQFQHPAQSPFTGKLYEECTRDDNWTDCSIDFTSAFADNQDIILPKVLELLDEASSRVCATFLENCKTNYPNKLLCGNLVTELMNSGRSYYAVTMMLGEIKVNTPSSWNINAGHLIMLEAFKRMLTKKKQERGEGS